jgi:hypothetical protein
MVAIHQHKPWLWGPLSLLGIGMAVVVAAIDQVHKWWMLTVYGIREGQRVTVLPFLDLEYVRNTGVSYGLFLQNSRQPRSPCARWPSGSPAGSPPGWWRSASD